METIVQVPVWKFEHVVQVHVQLMAIILHGPNMGNVLAFVVEQEYNPVHDFVPIHLPYMVEKIVHN
jgi:hypothetical protein